MTCSRWIVLAALALLGAACTGTPEVQGSQGALVDRASGLRLAEGSGTISALTRGAHAELAGEWERARLEYSRAIQRDPGDERAVVAFARTFVAEGRAREAAEYLQRQASSRPKSVALQRAAGEAMLAAGQPALGLPPLRRAHELAPDDPAVVSSLITALLLVQDHPGVAALLRQGAVGLVPDHLIEPTARAALAADEPRHAISLLLRALAARPAATDLWVDLGRAQLVLEEWDRAAQALLEALELDPAHGRALLLLGHVRLEHDDLVRARRCFESALANGIPSEEVAPLLVELDAAVRRRGGPPAGAPE